MVLLSLVTACRRHPPTEVMPPAQPVETLSPATHRDLQAYFLQRSYDWDTLEQGVPPLLIDRFPDDLREVAAGDARKRLFFLSLLPMVLLVNDEIREQRTTLQAIFARYDRKEPVATADIEQVVALANLYKVERDPLTNALARMLLINRVDIIPPSLVLAQAATESAYGTSRFARLGNNLFGEMVFVGDDGIKPLGNPVPYKARSFPTLVDSLRSYMLNLNTHPAYLELRVHRAAIRARGETPRGRDLANGLLAYSERGPAYIRDIKTVINDSRLSLLSDATLRKPEPLPALADTTTP